MVGKVIGTAVFTAALALGPSAAQAQFPASFDLSTLDGTNGFVINGGKSLSVSGAGDVNGDGFDDVIIGVDFSSPNGIRFAGKSYVVFGTNSGFSSSLNLSALDGTNGFAINGIDVEDNSGVSVSGAGDVNGDGFDDVIIAARIYGDSRPGESYVVFGKIGGFSSSLNLSTLDGTNGFVINGIVEADTERDDSVSGAGDVNGDGFDDLIVGVQRADPNGNSNAGESYVVFGKSSGFSSSLDVRTLDGTSGFVINGIDEEDNSGVSVSGAGDINGDGIDDLIIGARGADPNGNSGAGESYVVFGKSSGFSASLDLITLNGANGFVINGIDPSDLSGQSVSGAGDINGDGIDDLIIAAGFAIPNSRAGKSYVLFGSNGGFNSSLDLSTLNGSNGFVINGIDDSDFSEFSVSGAGDVNNDGFDDLIIGDRHADPNGNSGAGESYVVFGTNGGFSSSLDLATIDGTNGFVLNGINFEDDSGRSVSGAGDVNGDGIDDVIVSALGADPRGQVYVVFGRAASPDVLKGDVNMDGDVDFLDISPFISVLVSGDFLEEADVNGDENVDFLDIGPFIDILASQE
jgi:hypothetical protein